jgi:hypothetical protein
MPDSLGWLNAPHGINALSRSRDAIKARLKPD